MFYIKIKFNLSHLYNQNSFRMRLTALLSVINTYLALANAQGPYSQSFQTQTLYWDYSGQQTCDVHASDLLIVDCQRESIVYDFDHLIQTSNSLIVADQNNDDLTHVDLVTRVVDGQNRFLVTLENNEISQPMVNIDDLVFAKWSGSKSLSKMQVFAEGNPYPVYILLVLDADSENPQIALVTSQNDGVSEIQTIDESDVLSSVNVEGPVTHIDGSIDQNGRKYAVVLSQSTGINSNLNLIRLTKITIDGFNQLQTNSIAMYDMQGSEVNDLLVEDDFVFFSRPTNDQLDGDDYGVTGVISVYNVNTFQTVATLRGNQFGRNIGNKIQLRTSDTNLNLVGQQRSFKAYELFYDNWKPYENQRQYKVGRFIIFDDGQETRFFNDYDAFVPNVGLQSADQPFSFSVVDERIAIIEPNGQNLIYGHICRFNQFYTNLGQTSTANFCQECLSNPSNQLQGALITLGLQDTGCFTCQELQSRTQGSIMASFLYSQYCAGVQQCSAASIIPFSTNQMIFAPLVEGFNVETWPRSTYIQAPAQGCIQSFQLEFADGTPNEQITLNQFTGDISFTNRAGRTLDETITIVITTTGGFQSIVQRTGPLRVTVNALPTPTPVPPPTPVPVPVPQTCNLAPQELYIPTLEQIQWPINHGPDTLSIESAFISFNPQCPIRDYQLDYMSRQFYTIQVTGTNFKVQLKPEYRVNPGTYMFSVTPIGPSGQALTTYPATSRMRIGQAEFDCYTAMPRTFSVEPMYLPRQWYVETTIIQGSNTFISQPVPGCDQSFQLKMQDGSMVPSYYEMDSQTGRLIFTNLYDRLVNDQLVVVISSTDNVDRDERIILEYSYPHVQTTLPFTVQTLCGPDSTSLQPEQPFLSLVQLVDQKDAILSLRSSFISTNPLCPVQSFQMTEGSQYFDFSQDQNNFQVTLKNEYSSADRHQTYFATIVATAAGGITSSATVQITTVNRHDCNDAVLTSSIGFFQFMIPASGESVQTLFQQSLDYISTAQGCGQSFTLMMTDGSPAPSYYQLDQSNGQIRFINKANQLVNDQIVVVINTERTGQSVVRRTDTISVVSACGPDSTTVLAPQLDYLSQPANSYNQMEQSVTFQSTNIMCPIVEYELVQQLGEDNVELIQLPEELLVRLKPQFSDVLGEYTYTIRAIASGGAQSVAIGQMAVTQQLQDCSDHNLLVPRNGEVYTYCIQRSGQEINTIFQTKFDFMTDIPGCFQNFDLQLADDFQDNFNFDIETSPAPNYYSFDDQVGTLRFTNRASQPVNDNLILAWSSSTYEEEYQGMNWLLSAYWYEFRFTIQNECCIDSTTIIEPLLQTIIQPANIERNLLQLENKFTSTSFACPIQTLELISGAEFFTFVSYGVEGFRVTLLPAVEGEYQYQIRATAVGGASKIANGAMILTRPLYDCAATTLFDVQSFRFQIPNPSIGVGVEDLFSLGEQYIDNKVFGCTYTWDLQRADGSIPPDYYSVNHLTGGLQLELDPYRYVNDLLELIVSVDGGPTQVVFRTNAFSVVVECGPQSTTITPPQLQRLESYPNDEYLAILGIIGIFRSSNPNCPIVTNQLSVGYDEYSMNDKAERGFRIDLLEYLLDYEGEYFYTVIGTALGGATGVVSNSMIVHTHVRLPDCELTTLSFVPSFIFKIPNLNSANDFGSNVYEVLFSQGEFVTDRFEGCEFTFKLQTTAGDSAPDYYILNEFSGRLEYENTPNRLVNDLLEVVVTVTGGDIPVELKTNAFSVIAECGPQSTTVIAPQLQVVQQQFNSGAYDLYISDSFDSSNPTCPIRTNQLSQGFADYLIDDNAFDGFIVNLRTDRYLNEGVYPYTILAIAEGGASQTASSSMVINAAVIMEPQIPDCTATTFKFIQSFFFEIPRPGSNTVEELFQSSDDYIETFIEGCTYNYMLKQIDGTDAPFYYTLNPLTGRVLFDNSANRKVDDLLVIFIAVTGGATPIVLQTNDFTVNAQCGDQSTEIQAPSSNTQSIEAFNDDSLSFSGQFISTNEQCPILRNQIQLGSVQYAISDYGAAGFSIYLTGPYQDIAGEYPYTVSAIAEGGAIGTTSGSMGINGGQQPVIPVAPAYECADTSLSMYPIFDFDIPNVQVDSMNEVIVRSSDDFIQTRIPGCSYNFRLESADGSIAPNYYSLSYTTGKLTFSNFANRRVNDQLVIVVTASGADQSNVDLRTNSFQVTSQCGMDSTSIVVPNLQGVSKLVDSAGNLRVSDSFSSTNNQCPILRNELTEGQTYFQIQDYQANGFQVDLSSQFLDIVGQYVYSIKAFAEGGASRSVTNSMTIDQPLTQVYNCESTSLLMDQSFNFNIPSPESSRLEELVSSSNDFIISSVEGCTYSYRLESADGSPAPNYYVISESTGRIIFENVGTRRVEDQLVVIVTAIGGPSPVPLRTNTFEVVNQCGQDSTDVYIQTPSPQIQSQEVNSANSLSVTGQFVSTNNLCPIVTNELTIGSNNFAMNDLTNDAQDGFRINLNSQLLGFAGEYSYSITAEALGGATGSFAGSMVITQQVIDCGATSLYVNPSFNYDIPRPGRSTTVELISSSGEFIASPIGGCTYSYRLKNDRGQSAPNYYSISELTGRITFENAATRRVNDQLVIVVTVIGGAQTYELETNSFSVVTQCGQDSTDIYISEPEPEVRSVVVNGAGSLTVTGSFVSSNELCPILTNDLTLGMNNFNVNDLTGDAADGFRVSLQPVFLAIQGVYSYTVTAASYGGATGAFTGSMVITEPIVVEPQCQQTQPNFIAPIIVDIPKPGEEREEELVQSGTQFMILPIQGCIYQYEIVSENGSPAPGYYIMSRSTGRLTFNNLANRLVDDRLRVIIRISGQASTIQTNSFQVISKCGEESTDIIISEPAPQVQSQQVDNPGPLSVSGFFTSSNVLCPIQSYELSRDSQQHYTITEDAFSGFQINLNQNRLGIYGEYPYTVIATAEGDGTGLFTSSMVITAVPTNDCSSSEIQTPDDFFSFVPASDEEIITLFNLNNFLSPINPQCNYAVSIERSDGSPAPRYYFVEQTSGAVIFTNGPNYVVDDEIRITVLASNSGSTHIFTTEPFTVETECGEDSTLVITPNDAELDRVVVGGIVQSVTGRFGLSNPTCPISNIMLSTRSSTYFSYTISQDMSFTIRRNAGVDPGLFGDEFTLFVFITGQNAFSYTAPFDYSTQTVLAEQLEAETETVDPVIFQQPNEIVLRTTTKEDVDWKLFWSIIALVIACVCCLIAWILYCFRQDDKQKTVTVQETNGIEFNDISKDASHNINELSASQMHFRRSLRPADQEAEFQEHNNETPNVSNASQLKMMQSMNHEVQSDDRIYEKRNFSLNESNEQMIQVGSARQDQLKQSDGLKKMPSGGRRNQINLGIRVQTPSGRKAGRIQSKQGSGGQKYIIDSGDEQAVEVESKKE